MTHTPISPEQREQLMAAACAARSRAYARYSRFPVGAALLSDDGRLYTGVNIENASYGLTVCAERNAVGAMVNDGALRITAVAVCTDNGVTPCGACRQVLSEFVDHERCPRLDHRRAWRGARNVVGGAVAR
ncbi:MAG: cytidine deaminase [Candidatus Promineofilum sp.]|nr:cytidine deaminase [Promineifilum sp.]